MKKISLLTISAILAVMIFTTGCQDETACPSEGGSVRQLKLEKSQIATELEAVKADFQAKLAEKDAKIAELEADVAKFKKVEDSSATMMFDIFAELEASKKQVTKLEAEIAELKGTAKPVKKELSEEERQKKIQQILELQKKSVEQKKAAEQK